RKPFRFGVLAEHVCTRDAVLELARRAEDGGYSTFLIRDHFLEEPFGRQLGPLATLATVAATTKRLRIGSLVFANDYRSPVLLAQEAATLDLLSGGRFELGLGTGFLRAEYEQAGIPFTPPRTRVDRFAEALRVLKGVFAGEPFTFSGEHYAVTGLTGFPKPTQRPHPPILIGAGGRRMLSLAAREADIIGVLTTSTANGVLADDPTLRLAESVSRQIGWIREAAGDRFDRIELSMVASLTIADDRQRAAEELIRARGWREITPEQVLAMPSVFIGSPERIAEEMQARRERYGFSYYVISSQSMAAASLIVARLAGS
ncbi:MAG: TIGR03621 family F420-dependent LLM class oxidoreductase, partial [Thermomicrobiaceae bacterium]|nr:TIGR03621 family F420-dependent LLM class oxidoreductase [Thermomicrobiaceae bacterium]